MDGKNSMSSVYRTFCDSATQFPGQDFLHIPLQASRERLDLRL